MGGTERIDGLGARKKRQLGDRIVQYWFTIEPIQTLVWRLSPKPKPPLWEIEKNCKLRNLAGLFD
jgi:hypothetical protein